ncbi:hypothetical protein LMH63_12735 [Spiribacter halobius]|uniref:hypothetical protein n=1 Tax=Sediminicurvatus halobius TaxID=2182432 RepID=UPI001E635320|nr:hypothetical protein [Spiribacter halobius]UEX76821.1 hypothetical protein LMH63_12735 [Spiribacter halobius]
MAEMAAECWDQLHQVGQSRYLGGKKVKSHGLRFAKRALLLVTDEEAGTARCITDRAEIRAFFDSKAGERDGVSFRYVKRGTLAVPMRDAKATLWGLQFIFPAGRRRSSAMPARRAPSI